MLPPTVAARLDALIAGGGLPLPVLPEAAAQVLALIERPDCDARRLAELFRRDPAMTAHVMQVAGSPMYAAANKVASLQQAITRLGFGVIVQIAIAVAAKAKVFRVTGFETEVKAAFRHALTTALYAQQIARTRKSTVDAAFLAGLFHDFGQPVLIQALVDLHRELGATVVRDDVLAAVEGAHAEVGARLVASWAMPDRIADAVRSHHAHHAEGGELATVIALADWFAHGASEPQAFSARLNMYAEDVDAVARRADDIAATVESLA